MPNARRLGVGSTIGLRIHISRYRATRASDGEIQECKVASEIRLDPRLSSQSLQPGTSSFQPRKLQAQSNGRLGRVASTCGLRSTDYGVVLTGSLSPDAAVTIVRGAKPCFFKSLRINLSAARLSRLAWTRISRTSPFWSIARHRYIQRPPIETYISSRCHCGCARGRPCRNPLAIGGPNLFTPRRTVSYDTSTPRSAMSSSTSRKLRLNRAYSQTVRWMIDDGKWRFR